MESKILEILYSNRYTKKQVVDEIAKNMKNPKVRQELIHILDELSLEITVNEMLPIVEEMLKYDDTKEALLNDWQILVSDFDNGLSLVKVLIQDEEIKKDMSQHIEVLRDNVDWRIRLEIDELIDVIWRIDETGKGLKQLAIKRILSSSCFGKIYINRLLDRHETREILRENIQEIMQNCCNDSGLSNIIHMVDKFKWFLELEDIYNKNKFVMDLYYKTIEKIKREREREILKEYQKEIYKGITKNIIGTVIKEEKQEEIEMELMDLSKGKPINFLSMGAYSLVFRTNGKVFKLGIEREKFLIEKYHRRFMYPILRKNYDYNLYIEAYEAGYNDPNITDEELLMVYEELYRSGFIWLDAKKENLVRLEKDNVLSKYIKQRDDTKFGFKKSVGEDVSLKKGELAVCDLDYIYYKDDLEIKNGNCTDKSVDIIKEFRKKLEAEEREGDLEK